MPKSLRRSPFGHDVALINCWVQSESQTYLSDLHKPKRQEKISIKDCSVSLT
ncbi:hypothetical protein LC608_24185 [Nostoc sp. XA010]|uniref:hypothetical protein n=1 Tax=Nostoc sp. XA010 TaxID=2780407 RepID=UPI001E5D8776|nr:hypothetical protein [Nostoc sp. XA010]MCC5660021.1 hypothetical protein [Nostoc sp. XA010]